MQLFTNKQSNSNSLESRKIGVNVESNSGVGPKHLSLHAQFTPLTFKIHNLIPVRNKRKKGADNMLPIFQNGYVAILAYALGRLLICSICNS